MSTGTQVCEVTLPGYTLVERIGSGGYAEVWRAEAPGGLQKAVKIVYGYCDDEFASQELKVLERVKGVRHPFLLSLERFEVINGRLTILTELADMSLDQRLRQCRAEGKSGIPRDELLRYLSDAAEAIDFLSQRHQLLHLDIKPENLLVLGDHVKVADFGLVKELATRTQNSLVAGMTPTYASPEMFDDEPSAQSDQYSLAIVYQEMLVGTLPFPGRTPAQLAKQHTQAEPQLMSLPSEDRPAITRALAKRPEDRFPSCRALVDTLLRRAEMHAPRGPIELPAPAPIAPPPFALPPSTPADDDTMPPSFCTTRRRPNPTPDNRHLTPDPATVTLPLKRGTPAAELRPTATIPAPIPQCEETTDIPVPEPNALLRRQQPTLYVAIGGVGIQVLCRLRALTANRAAPEDTNSAVEAIALDTDRNELRDACAARWSAPLAAEDTLHLPLRLPKSYENSREILSWVSRRWLYNIPRSLETRGYRALGRIALVDHATRVLALVDQKLQRLATLRGSTDVEGEPRDESIKVVILCGTGGGTGAGMAIDVANAAKSLAAGRGLQAEIHGYLICNCLGSQSLSPLMAANTYSLLTELNHASFHGNETNSGRAAQTPAFESREPPFDCVYCVPPGTRALNSQAADVLDNLARYLALEGLPDARAVLRSCRAEQSPREQALGRTLSLRKLGYASLADHKRDSLSDLAGELAEAVKRHWLTEDTSVDWERLVHEEHQAASVPKLSTAPDAEPGTPPTVLPPNDASPLALRGRFKEHLSSEFASEVLRQIGRQLEARDDRGRPLILPRDAKLIVDTACGVIGSVAAQVDASSSVGRVTESAALRPLIAEGSRRVIRAGVEKVDLRQPERFLPIDALDELVRDECQLLLEQSLTQLEFATALNSLLDVDQGILRTIDSASADLLQCGCDRRTLMFVPRDATYAASDEKLRAVRPQGAIFPADVYDLTIVSEESGIAPYSLAQGLERVFPGIADAARRLLTRIDVEWQSLV